MKDEYQAKVCGVEPSNSNCKLLNELKRFNHSQEQLKSFMLKMKVEHEIPLICYSSVDARKLLRNPIIY